MICGLLPCAGNSSRLYNVPKFMLPIKNKKISLLTNWINIMFEQNCEKIVIGVSEITKYFVKHTIDTQLNEKQKENIIIKEVGNTDTMNGTILMMIEHMNYELFIMGMPDTFINKISPGLIKEINTTNNIIGAYIWNIRESQKGKIGQCDINESCNIITDIIDKNNECDYKYGWGSIVFKKEFIEFISKDEAHIGYSMKKFIDQKNNLLYDILHDQYFDCGTIEGYTEYLTYKEKKNHVFINGLIIIICVYINNEEKNYDILIECLEQVRKVYKNEIIVAVDNNSLNDKWHDTAKKLNIEILFNNSDIHKYEIGGYNLALQHFRSKQYIFIQGTIKINEKIDLNFDENNSCAVSFGKIENDLYWNEKGLNLINKLLNCVEMNNWTSSDGILLWNSFCCNDNFVKDLLNSGLFDLPCNSKNHSCAFERILASFFMKNLKKIETIPEHKYTKFFLNQNQCTL